MFSLGNFCFRNFETSFEKFGPLWQPGVYNDTKLKEVRVFKVSGKGKLRPWSEFGELLG